MKSLKTSLSTIVTLASLVVFGAMPSSEWRAKVGECAQDSSVLKSVIVQLSESDQLAFIGAVNEALAAKPGSTESKAVSFYDANRAALVALSKSGNLMKALAEVYATVPPEFLTVINERFAKEVFKRDSKSSITDEQYVLLSSNAMKVVTDRTKALDNAAVRQTFAALMFVRASEPPVEGLQEKLAAMISDESAKKTAVQEWMAPALKEGSEKSYDSMLGAAQAGDEPNHDIVLRMYPYSSVGNSLVGDLRNLSLKDGVSAEKIGGILFRTPEADGLSPNTVIADPLYRVPRPVFDPESPYYQGKHRGDKVDSEGGSGGGGRPDYPRPPQPYRGQRTKVFGNRW
jgi:hypothetical protein